MKNEPKIKPVFEGCYNYKKLEKEGLLDEKINCFVDDDEVNCETWEEPVCDI